MLDTGVEEEATKALHEEASSLLLIICNVKVKMPSFPFFSYEKIISVLLCQNCFRFKCFHFRVR